MSPLASTPSCCSRPSRSAGHQQRQKGSRANQDHPAATTGVARWQQLEARRRTLQGEDTCDAATQGKHGSGPARRRHSQRQRQRRRASHDDKLDDSARCASKPIPRPHAKQQCTTAATTTRTEARQGSARRHCAGGPGRGGRQRCQQGGRVRPRRRVEAGSAKRQAVATPNTNSPTRIAPSQGAQSITTRRRRQEHWKWSRSTEAAATR